MSIAQALAQIDAYPVPKGVSSDRWATLTAQLKQSISANSAAGKTLSSAPTGTNNAVSDLAAAANGAGTQATVTWTEKLWGDYNNDGSVDIADLAPMAQYYGADITAPPADGHMLVNAGDGTNSIDIDDLQPIAADYSMHLQGYMVWRGHFNGTSVDWETTPRPNPNAANPNWSADRTATPPVSTRPTYTYTDDLSAVTDKANVRYKVTAYGDGAAGVESNVAVMPPPTATTFNVSGAVTLNSNGLAGVTLTLTPGGLNATTAADGTYTITGVANGAYTLTPSLSGYTFSPANRSVTVAGADVTAQFFSATQVHSVSGTVLFGVSGLPGVTLTLTPGGLNATTASDGTFTIADVPDGSYTLTPSLTGYGFTPPNRSVTVSGADVTAQYYTATTGLSTAAWPKFRGNYLNTGLSTHVASQTGSLKWSATLSGPVNYSSPAIGLDGTVYIGDTTGDVSAVNPTDGSIKWTHATGGSIFSSPAIGAGGAIYIGSQDSNLYALNASDGSVLWTYTTSGMIDGGPAVALDGTIYVGSNDGSLYAINPADGSLKWSRLTGGAISSTPAIAADGTLYIGSGDGNVYALNPNDGSVKWMFTTANVVPASAAIGADGTVYIGSFDHMFYALDPLNGTVKWQASLGAEIRSSAAIASDGGIWVGSRDGSLYRIPSNGVSPIVEYLAGNYIDSSPAIGGDGTIYVGDFNGFIKAIPSTGGAPLWSYTAGASVSSSPAIAADGTVYVASNDGKLYAFGP